MLPETQRYVARADISQEKIILTTSLAKPRQNAKAVFKTYELFMETYVTLLIHFVKMY